RSDWGQLNHNYLGFPEGISIVELGERGREQAERYGARIFDTQVASVIQDDHGFVTTAAGMTHHSRGVILATGVTDRWVEFPGFHDYIGKTMHWCIVCDGFEMQRKRVLVVGNDAHAAELAIQMLGFNVADVTVLTNSGALGLQPATVQELHDRGIRLIVDRLVDATARKKGFFRSVRLEGGEEIELDHLFSAQGAEPNTELARALGVELNAEGYIKVDTEAKTSVPGVYAAGDVTRLFSHQVLTAAHEGGTAASALNHALYQQDNEAFQAGRVAIGAVTS
ncbi:MAG TPA: NAD(P)/FAD-dependent oxidoreductase, partial [Thermomicrobiales bacterium]|nr:NAD(P)/FAD-dependent oxidoreductase [Thermomicrobiales bacterium]